MGYEVLQALSHYMELNEFEHYKPKVPDTISENHLHTHNLILIILI